MSAGARVSAAFGIDLGLEGAHFVTYAVVALFISAPLKFIDVSFEKRQDFGALECCCLLSR